MKLLIRKILGDGGSNPSTGSMATETLVFLDECVPPGLGTGLHNQFGLDVATVDDFDLRWKSDKKILAVIKEIEFTRKIKVILVTADKTFAKQVENSIFLKHVHSIKKPTPDNSKKYYKNQLYRQLVEKLLEEGLIKIEKDGESIN